MRQNFTKKLAKLQQNEIILDIGEKSCEGAGKTHFGGVPDVPPEFKWPAYTDAELGETYSINFLMQLNCADFVEYDKDGLLPKEGLLSFFYDAEGQPWEGKNEEDGCIRVFWFEKVGDLVPANVPEDLEEESQFPCLSVNMKTQASYPGWEDYDLIRPNMSKEKRYEYCEALEAVYDDESEEVSKLLGWANVIQGTMLRDCDEMIYHTIRSDDVIIEDWQLLLQLSTVEYGDFSLMFGDCGSVYFYIKKEDLADRNFDNVCLVLQCG